MSEVIPNKTTNSQLDKAGIILVDTEGKDIVAYSQINEWRTLHLYPLNTIRTTLTKRLKSLKIKPIVVAQRLKRMPTIISKLKDRKRNIKRLSTMQDIGGVRIVLQNLKHVYKVYDLYKTKTLYQLEDEADYIEKPAKSGYRGIHLIFTNFYKDTNLQCYNGLKIELQIRTRLQHIWATTVETVGDCKKRILEDRSRKSTLVKFLRIS